jgi:ABC-2 type transport system permease protein
MTERFPTDRRQLWLLFKNRLLAQTGINIIRHHRDPRKRRTRIAVLLIVAFCLGIFMLYCAGGAWVYGLLGMEEMIPALSMVAAASVILLFTVFKANGDLYAFRDYDLLLSLPLSLATVVRSRLLNLYFWNLVISVLVLLPMGLVYIHFARPEPEAYFFLVSGLLVSPLIPTAAAALIGAGITAVASKSRHAGTISIVLGFIFVLGVLGFGAALPALGGGSGIQVDPATGQLDVSGFAALAPSIVDALNKAYPPAILYGNSVLSHSLADLVLFAAVSGAAYLILVRILLLKYREINTALTSRRAGRAFALNAQPRRSALLAVAGKSLLRILRSPVCATNLLMGSFFTLVLGGAFVVAGPQRVLAGLDLQNFPALVAGGAPFLLAGIASMTNTGALLLALEGRSIWILRSIPIRPGTLYGGFLLTNLTFTVPPVAIAGILFSVTLDLGPAGGASLLFTALALVVSASVAGILVGNRMAYYDWQEESQLVKQSFMSLLGMLGSAALILGLGVLANLPGLPLEASARGVILAALALAASGVLFARETQRPVREAPQ